MKHTLKKIDALIISSCFLILTSYNCFSQVVNKCDPTIFKDSLLDKLTGNWIANGTMGSDKVTYNCNVQWKLNHQFLEMQLIDTLPTHEYTASVFIGYNCNNGEYIIHWLDNLGGSFSETLGKGTKKNESLEMLFDYPEGKLMNTFFYNHKNDTWISDSKNKDENNNWIPFASLTFMRKH